MKNIAFVNGVERKCGIFYYGTSVFEILQNSTEYKFHFIEAINKEDFFYKTRDMDAIIYNWHPQPMPWCNKDVFLQVRKPQFLILGHTSNEQVIQFPNITGFITIDPDHQSSDSYIPGVRPVKLYDDCQYSPQSGVYKIGTSGTGDASKNINIMLSIINEQFTEPVEFNVHLSEGAFNTAKENVLVESLTYLKQFANPNVTLNFIVKHLSNYELVKFLNYNDINIFIYPSYDSMGVSASIDKALSAKKPIGVNNSNFFKHIISDEINLEKTPLKKIIANGTQPLQKFYDRWNPTELINQYETMLRKHNV
jgi:hypothetical protein